MTKAENQLRFSAFFILKTFNIAIQNKVLNHNIFLLNYLFDFETFKTDSIVTATPSFLKIFLSTSESITVV